MTTIDIVMYILMCIVAGCTYIAYIPQIVRLYKTKKSEDISISSWILWITTSVSGLIYSILLGRWELILTDISELGLEITVLILTIKYRHKNKNFLN